MTLDSAKSYWAAGITLSWLAYAGSIKGVNHSGWGGTIAFCDEGGVNNDDTDGRQVSTEGTLSTRYMVRDSETTSGLKVVIDTLLTDAAQLGITWRNPAGGTPELYFEGDGGDKDYPPPVRWRELLTEQAARIGWRTYGYRPPVASA